VTTFTQLAALTAHHIDVCNKKLLLYYCACSHHKYSASLEDQKKNRSKAVAGQGSEWVSE